MRILLTGQSGLKIEQAFRRYADDAALFPHGQQPHVVKLEAEMARLYLNGKEPPTSPAIWVREVLAQPIGKLRKLWSDAFDVCMKKVDAVTDPDAAVILNLHGTFYHSYTVEYISLYSSAQLKQFNADMVVTLIDDIYDVHQRLQEPDHIFHPSIAGNPNRVKSVFQLLRILDWRAKEVMISRQIAHDCGPVSHYVLAIKHAHWTVFNLMSRRLPCVYLSHPITQVRRLLQRNEQERNRARQIIRVVEEIESAACRRITLFSPTTIDELRIRSESTAAGVRYLPQLSERWNEDKYADSKGLLFHRAECHNRDPLWSSDEIDPHEKEVLAPILGVLVDEISRQISSRDHKLVEQSPSLLVYRPFFCGNASSGVRKELDYFHAFRGIDTSLRFCLIVMPDEDTQDLKAQFLEEGVRAALSLGDLVRRNNEKPFTFSEIERKDARAAVEIGVDAMVHFLGQIVNSHLMDYPPRVSLESDLPLEGPKRLWRIAALCLRDANELVSIYENRADYVERRGDLSGEAIVDLFVEQLTLHQKSKEPQLK